MAQTLRMTIPKFFTKPEISVQKRIAQGDESGLRDLFDTYGRSMYAFAYRLLQDPASADEAVQESLLAVWKGASSFRGEGRLITWLLGIVYHKSLNILRKRNDLRLDEGEVQLISNDSPDDIAEVHELSDILNTCIQQLPHEHRSVLQLVFFHQLSLSEVAQVLNCPEGTVKSRLFFAKASMKGILTRSGFRLEDLI